MRGPGRAQLPVRDVRPVATLESARRGYRGRVLFLYPLDQPWVLRHARPADAPAIHALLETFVPDGALLPRTLEQVYQSIRDFVVAADGERIVGCGALRIHSSALAEIGALAVARDRQAHGVGRRIVRALTDEARALGIDRVFALTLQERFFHRQSFRTVAIAEFPEKIARDCARRAKRNGCIEIAVVHDIEPDVRTRRH